jgi:hypothetical protein
MPRRTKHDPLATSLLPGWLVERDMAGSLLTVTAIEPGADLHTVIRDAMAAHAAAGWQIEGDNGYGFYIASRTGERHLVSITPVDPRQPPNSGHGSLASRP